MIIGRGQIAQSFANCQLNNCIIFASGVSDSTCQDKNHFLREKALILDTLQNNANKTFVYFSSCALSDQSYPKNAYYKHKANMENLIKGSGNPYYIFRLPQVFGRLDERPTLINFIYHKIKNQEEFSLFDNAYRYVIDVKDLKIIVETAFKYQKKNTIIDIANPYKYKVIEIVALIEKLCGIQANYQLIEKTDEYTLDLAVIKNLILQNNLSLDFGENYLELRLMNYIEHNK